MENKVEKTIEVLVGQDGLTASVMISPGKEEQITTQDIKKALEVQKVVFGVNWELVESIVSQRCFFQEVEIAKGIEPKDGQDGWFEYLFETNVDLKPKILKDGSVDYKSMGEVPVVEENQELVRYHPATKGENGKNVRGDDIVGKKGKDLQALKGKGFLLSEDKTLYRAAVTGKATAKGGTLKVTNVLEIKGDVSISTGGVNFAGDIIIKGNVLAGTQVHAYGNIEVNGCVEAATLTAGKSVVLKNGMQGNGKGIIQAGGDVSGKFFEQVKIEAKGNVFANAIMNCDIQCGNSVQVAGRLGIIVGGKVFATKEIEATLLGNMAETKTYLEVGSRENLVTKMQHMEQEIQEVSLDILKYSRALEKLEDIIKKQGQTPELKKNKMTIMRGKIEKEAKVADIEKQKGMVADMIGKCAVAKICVLKSIYPGVVLTINGVSEKIKSENYNSTYQKKGCEIGFTSNI